jgi:hypothetical protein
MVANGRIGHVQIMRNGFCKNGEFVLSYQILKKYINEKSNRESEIIEIYGNSIQS